MEVINGSVNLSLYGINGQQIHVSEISGGDSVSIPTSSLPTGIYIFSFVKDGKTVNKKVVLR